MSCKYCTIYLVLSFFLIKIKKNKKFVKCGIFLDKIFVKIKISLFKIFKAPTLSWHGHMDAKFYLISPSDSPA
jgi:hypothetical protein